MTRPLHQLDDHGLAAALGDAGGTLPDARRDVAAAVGAALRASATSPTRRGSPHRARRGAVAVALLLVAVAGGAIAAGIVPGIDVRVGSLTGATAPLVDDAAFFGDRTNMAGARDWAAFVVRAPAADLGDPQVFVAGRGSRARVSFVYPSSAAFPPIGDARAGLMITQFRGTIDPALLQKTVAPGVRVSAVDIDGVSGWWIDGAHEVLYLDDAGRVTTERVRYAERTLLWSVDGVTQRLEADVPLARALQVARAMH